MAVQKYYSLAFCLENVLAETSVNCYRTQVHRWKKNKIVTQPLQLDLHNMVTH